MTLAENRGGPSLGSYVGQGREKGGATLRRISRRGRDTGPSSLGRGATSGRHVSDKIPRQRAVLEVAARREFASVEELEKRAVAAQVGCGRRGCNSALGGGGDEHNCHLRA